MEQLKMVWKKCKAPEIKAPDGFTVRTFDGSDKDINAWLDTVAEGLTEKRENKDFFYSCMYSHGELEYDKFFMIEHGGEPAATVAVICDHEKKEGYIHMVACREKFRGRGVGTFMSGLAVKTLISAGMETAYLTTDDFRLPAIKSYLRAGFYPAIPDEEHENRWNEVYKRLGIE